MYKIHIGSIRITVYDYWVECIINKQAKIIDGRWEARITIGRKANGNQKFKYFYAKTRQECSEKLTEFMTAWNNGTYIEPCKMLLSEWLDEWYNSHVIGSVKTATRVSYEMIIRQHLKPSLRGY